jgi:transcriptional regulator with PAS, ATPase and Fis domain
MSRENDITAEIVNTVLQNGVACDLKQPEDTRELLPLAELVEKTELQAISRALSAANGNRSAAARRLGITRPLLYKKMIKYGLK